MRERDAPCIHWALNYDQSTKIMIMKVIINLQKNHSCYFQHFLCEDRSTASESHFSYVDFLCHMHKVILLPIMFYSTLISFTLFSPMSDFFSKHILFQEIRAMLSWGNGVNDKWSQEHLFQPAVSAWTWDLVIGSTKIDLDCRDSYRLSCEYVRGMLMWDDIVTKWIIFCVS